MLALRDGSLLSAYPRCPRITLLPASMGVDCVVRVLFAAEPNEEQTVRLLIVAALSRGRSTMPDLAETGWRLVQHRTEEVTPDEREQAAGLTKQ